MRYIPFVLVLIAACSRSGASPAEFAHAWVAVDIVEDPDTRDRDASTFVATWKDKSYTWEGLALASLCANAARTCAMSFWNTTDANDRARLGGLYPRVTFTDAAFADLHVRCKGQTTCAITIRGTMSMVAADADTPMCIAFTDATIVNSRAADDSWFAPQPAVAAATKQVRANANDIASSEVTHATKVF